MSDHFAKFVFIGAVVLGILFSRAFYATRGASSEPGMENVSGTALAIPRFVFPQTMVSAEAVSPPPPPASATVASSAPAGTSSSSVPAPVTAAALPPSVDATAYLITNLQTGKVIAEKNPDRRWPTASLAKLMAATIVLDKIDLGTQINVTEHMFAADPTEVNLQIGGRYTALDLLRAMLLPSSNVAAEAVATFYGRDAFIAEMNARAEAWGMGNTHYDDPSGISVGDESTPNDLAKLAAQVYARYPQLLSISRTPQFAVTENTSGRVFTLRSINPFAGQADFVGGKTGHTEEADGNLLSIFRAGQKPILIVVLGSDYRSTDTQALYEWLKTQTL